MNEDRKRITAAIATYLDLQGREPDEVTLRELAMALDGLVTTYFQTSSVEPSTQWIDCPDSIRRDVAKGWKTFPDLGWYASVEPERDEHQKVHLACAMNDLVEISEDLARVLWLFENGPEEDAIWDFRFGYQGHWGRHLHEVRFYLHTQCAW